MKLATTPLLACLFLTGCAAMKPVDLSGWNAQSENVTSMRIAVEADGIDFDAYPFGDNSIIFTSERAGNVDIFMHDLGTPVGAVQLTTNSGMDVLATPHPNGSNYVFLSDRAGESNPYYYMGERGKGTALSLVEVAKPYVGGFSPAHVSPDGKKILYTSGRSIWTYDLESREKRQLIEGYDASWTADGQRIVFTRIARDKGSLKTTSIWIMNTDGTEMTELVPGGDEVSVSHPRVSPDGRQIAYERATVRSQLFALNRNTGAMGFLEGLSESDIWVINIDGTDAVQITTHPMADAKPNWMTNNRIVFSSERPTTGDAKDRDWNIWLLDL